MPHSEDMADLKKRTKEEKNLTLAILLLLATIDDDDMLGGFLSGSFFQQRIINSSIPTLARRVYLQSAVGMLGELGMSGDLNLRKLLEQQSNVYTRQLADRLAGNQNDWYRRYQSNETAYDLTGADTDYSVKPQPYGKYEVAREAVTSVSIMNSDSQKTTATYLSDFRDVKTTFVWIPERDSRTCKICKAMGGTYEEFWSAHFPSGPPAHPNCRCFLSSIRVYAS